MDSIFVNFKDMNDLSLKNSIKNSIFDLTKIDLVNFFLENNLSKYRATQVYNCLYRQNINDVNNMTTLNNEIKELLSNTFDFSLPSIEKVLISCDGTRKYLLKLRDQNLIETVVMNHVYGKSICVTTQVGCNMGCQFCCSGIVKKIRDLTPGEIVSQILVVSKQLLDERISSCVIMGIGEPFDNYQNVIKFIQIINDPQGLEIGSRHITVSTCGLVPKIREFSLFPLQVNLAISLHFATDAKRTKFMPINKKYNLLSLKESLNYYYSITNRRITLEYILLDNINDTLEDCINLYNYIKDLNCYVNLIPYNETNTNINFKRSKNEKMFFDYLMQRKVNVIKRKELGSDILAACGQLRINGSD